MTENTPLGRPARSASTRHGQRRQRRFGGGAGDEGAAGGQRRGDLAGDHRVGEVPRRDRGDNADRLLDDGDALVAHGGRGWSRHRCAWPLRRTIRCRRRHRRSRPWPRPRACPFRRSGCVARSSWLAIIRSNHLRRICARSLPVRAAQSFCATSAAAMARAVSARVMFGHGADHVAPRGVGHGEGAAVVGIDPFAGDIGPGGRAATGLSAATADR